MARMQGGTKGRTVTPRAVAAAPVAAIINDAAGTTAGGVSTQQAGSMPAQEKGKANMDKVVKSTEELVSFGQGNVEALVKSGQIWMAGVQDLQKVMSASAQAQMEAAMGTFKALAGAKSLKEAMDMQASLARTSIETAMAETGKLTDASIKLAEQAMAPLAARVTQAVERFGQAA